MRWSKYSTLKSASKVSFEKKTVDGQDKYYLVKKQWDSETGEAIDDGKREYSLSYLESEKARYDADMARAKAESDELKKAIADFKKL
jgi:transposase-like protein